MNPRGIVFPRDELPHSTVIEWWYWNGHLRDACGAEYAFMHCLFKVNPKRVNLPFLERIPAPELFFSHWLVSDIRNKTTESGTHFFRGGIASAGASAELLYFTSREQFSLREHAPFSYALSTPQLDLQLISQKSPLLVNGNGWVPVKASGTYYYSLTDVRASGTLRLGGKVIPVRGVAWMDHQWSDEPASAEDKWNWFSLQLSNRTEILCCEYGDKTKIRFATISYADGRQATTHDVRLAPRGSRWTSPKTEAVYELAWTIELPEWHAHFVTAPKIDSQEVLFGSMNYWEGAIAVSGTCGGSDVSGRGFMELVGVPMGKSVAEVALREAEEHIAQYVQRHL